MGAERHSLDLNGGRVVSAVLVDIGTGFVACGVQLAVYAFGNDIEDALENFVSACVETFTEVCTEHKVDFAAVYGRGLPYFLGAGNLPYADRYMPDSCFGTTVVGRA